MAAQTKLKSRCETKEVLGPGGMGVAYRDCDTVIRRDVALKIIRDIPDPAALETFHKECSVLASTVHPNMNYNDERNCCSFEIDSKSLSLTVVRNGKKGLTIKVPRSLEKKTTYTLQVAVAGNTIRHKIFDGKSWVMLDELKSPGTDSTV